MRSIRIPLRLCAGILMMLMLLCAVPVSALESHPEGFNKNYVLTENEAVDAFRIGLAQNKRTGSQFGYRKAWCASFVSDCMRLAGVSTGVVLSTSDPKDFLPISIVAAAAVS